MRKLAGILALVMVLTMVSVPVFAAEVETDPTKLTMSENFVAFEEDFSDNSNGWELVDGAEIKDGKLYLSETGDTTFGTAKLPKINYSTKGNWYMTFKTQIIGGAGTGRSNNVLFLQMGAGANQSGRIYWNLRNGGLLNCSENAPAVAIKYYTDTIGWKEVYSASDRNFPDFNRENLYEYLFSFYTKDWEETDADGNPVTKTYDCYDYYRRPLDDDGTPLGPWEKINDKREGYWNSGSVGNYTFWFNSPEANKGAQTTIDDLKIYQGAYVDMKAPVIDGGDLWVDGTYHYGHAGIEKDREITVLSVVYDKKYGYTKQIYAEPYTATGGEWIDFSQNIYGVSEETDTAAAMIWSDVETGIPLIGAKDQIERNIADDVYEETASPVTYVTNFNEVTISGNIGVGENQITASLTEKATGNLAAAVQTTNNSVGKVKAVLGVDPAQWASGTYILRIQKGNDVAESHEVELFTNDILAGGVTSADDMESFLLNYAAEDVKAQASDEGFAESVFAQYQELAGENAGATDLYAFREYLDPSIQATVDERALLQAFNKEINEKVVVWGEVRTLLTETYKDTLGLSQNDIDKINAVRDQKALFTAFNGMTYTSKSEIAADLRGVVERMLAAQNNVGGGAVGGGAVGGGSYGGGSAGGGGNYLSGNKIGDTTEEPINQPPAKIEEGEESSEEVKGQTGFNDLKSVPWAKDSILVLQNLGVVSGDGSGAFYPDMAVTREEFLKMAMQAAGIEIGGKAASFSDVDPDAWYYDYVAAAYEMGIVNGMEDGTFGIGQEITRADMAVMLDRILKNIGIEIIPEQNAYVFDDYMTIPKYARESITTLCQGGLMNGVGDNRFDAPASATRAESAVAIYRIYNYIAERR